MNSLLFLKYFIFDREHVNRSETKSLRLFSYDVSPYIRKSYIGRMKEDLFPPYENRLIWILEAMALCLPTKMV